MATSRVDIGAYKDRFNGRFGKFKQNVMISLFKSVILDSPVLTGRLRASWRFGKEIISGEVQPEIPYKKGDPLPLPYPDSVQPMTQAVKDQVTGADGSYYLSNPMEYANRIEYEGHSSTKAPEGMVRKNIVRITEILKSEVDV